MFAIIMLMELTWNIGNSKILQNLEEKKEVKLQLILSIIEYIQ